MPSRSLSEVPQGQPPHVLYWYSTVNRYNELLQAARNNWTLSWGGYVYQNRKVNGGWRISIGGKEIMDMLEWLTPPIRGKVSSVRRTNAVNFIDNLISALGAGLPGVVNPVVKALSQSGNNLTQTRYVCRTCGSTAERVGEIQHAEPSHAAEIATEKRFFTDWIRTDE